MPGTARTTKSLMPNLNGRRRRSLRRLRHLRRSRDNRHKYRNLIGRKRQAALLRGANPAKQMLRAHVMPPRNLGNRNPGIERLGDDPPLLQCRPSPAASHPGAYLHPPKRKLRVAYSVGHMCETFPPNQREACDIPRASIKVGAENRLRYDSPVGSGCATAHENSVKLTTSMDNRASNARRRPLDAEQRQAGGLGYNLTGYSYALPDGSISSSDVPRFCSSSSRCCAYFINTCSSTKIGQSKRKASAIASLGRESISYCTPPLSRRWITA